MRNDSLVRALSLKATLESGRRWTLAQLAERFSVTERTVYRDLATLEMAGVPVCSDTPLRGDGRGGVKHRPALFWVLR